MTKIMDYETSKPKRLNRSRKWTQVWEVIVQRYTGTGNEIKEEIVARFFDPWKAAKYGRKEYGIFRLAVSNYMTANLTKNERGEKV